MSRIQATVIAALAGLVLLVFIGVAVLVIAPLGAIFSPATPTPSPSPTVTPTPTFPNFMPTPSLITPTPAEPTPTNTRLPTATPDSAAAPTATAPFQLPTLVFKPTATPTPLPPTVPVELPPTATPVTPLQYNVRFEAEETELTRGDCTDLEWRVEGQVQVWLDDDPVDPSGSKEVCPRQSTSYTLETQIIGTTEIRRTTVEITVERDQD